MAKQPAPSGPAPVHPGEILKEDVFPALKLPVDTIADKLGVSRNQLYKVMRGSNGVSPEMALRLGKLCGNGPEFWLRLQANYDLAIARQALAGEIDKIPTLREPEAA